MQYLHKEIYKLYENFRKTVVCIQEKNVPKYIPICTGYVIMTYNMIFSSTDRAFYERNDELYNLRFHDMSLMEDTEKSYRQELKRAINGKCGIEYIDMENDVKNFTEKAKNREAGKNMLKTNNNKIDNIQLPEEEYIHREENGKQITICTLRQKAMHTIGLNAQPKGRLYIRHGKKYYRPYRNYFTGYDSDLEKLVYAGYMVSKDETIFSSSIRTYWFNRKGLDWLGEQLDICIHDEDK